MSELRWNPQLKQWVIVASHRQDRTYKPPAEFCPLCPTLPGAFPTEVPAEDYEIVVFENKFPSLRLPRILRFREIILGSFSLLNLEN